MLDTVEDINLKICATTRLEANPKSNLVALAMEKEEKDESHLLRNNYIYGNG